tara:strand:- start:3451 stop:4068 length:618 start_codon:yes stop_codon:yes gene_type:complete
MRLEEGKLKAAAAFIDLARKYGAKLIRSKKHNVFRDAAGHQITAPKTTSDFRAIKNFEAELRGRGFVKQTTLPASASTKPKPKPTVQKPEPTLTPKQRYEAGEKGLRTGNQTTFKDFMQKVDAAAKPPVQSTAQRMAQGYDRNVAPAVVKKGEQLLRNIQRINRRGRLIGEDNKHRDAKLLGQYRQLQDPPKPPDPLKPIRLKKV